MKRSRYDVLSARDTDTPAAPRVGTACPCCGERLDEDMAGEPACRICAYPRNSAAWVDHDGC